MERYGNLGGRLRTIRIITLNRDFQVSGIHPGSLLESVLGIASQATHLLKLTANAPENGWLEYDCFLLGPGLFSGTSC